jgi:hypothetical protein
MNAPVLIQKATARQRDFVVGIYRDGNGIIVRKSEVLAGIKVPLNETYVLDIESAVWMMNFWVSELHGHSVN